MSLSLDSLRILLCRGVTVSENDRYLIEDLLTIELRATSLGHVIAQQFLNLGLFGVRRRGLAAHRQVGVNRLLDRVLYLRIGLFLCLRLGGSVDLGLELVRPFGTSACS